jgi:LacI family transcriptional regulator
MAKNKKNVTISDIAKLAGVSIATVSRVLSGTDYPVREELKQKILDTANQMGYKPNVFSQMLRKGKSCEIGIVVPSITNPFYSQLLSAAEQECISQGYVPFICNSISNPHMELNHLNMLEERNVAGIILSSVCSSEVLIQRLKEVQMPLILFDQSFEGYKGDCIQFDFFKGAYLATEYLIQCGHRDIVFASGELDRRSRCLMYDGYKQALKDLNLNASKRKVIYSSDEDQNYDKKDYYIGQEIGKLLLQKDYLPDAVVTVNDMIAIGLINYLKHENIQVPHDVSVLGFDDIAISEMVTPALSTIHQPATETGSLAAKVLIDRIEDVNHDTVQILMQPYLVERDSVRKIHKKVRRW